MSNLQNHDVSAATERIKLRLRRTAEDIIAIGQDLIVIKNSLPHGEFLPWIERQFEMTKRSAQRFIQVADRFSGKSDTMSFFNPTIIYELAAPSTPQVVVEQVTEKAQQGESVSVAEVKELKRQLKESEQEKQEMLALFDDSQAEHEQEVEKTKQQVTVLQNMLRDVNLRLERAQEREPEVIEKEVVIEKPVIPERYKSEDDAVKQLQKERKELSNQIYEKQKILKDMSSFVNSAEHQKQIAFDAKTVYARMVNAYRDISDTLERIANDPHITENQSALIEIQKLENFFEDRLSQVAIIKRRAKTVNVRSQPAPLMIGIEAVEVSA